MTPSVVIIGGGPAGLIAAEIIARAGIAVELFERKTSVGRKFLMAGRGGLNITHSEPLDIFVTRYRSASAHLAPLIQKFSPADLRSWGDDLGAETFVGSSGRVFPKAMKASPLLRAWKERLTTLGVVIHTAHDWMGWDDKGAVIFKTVTGDVVTRNPAATLLALGGGSWQKLGSDGSWAQILAAKNVTIAPIVPANCGFVVAWSDIFRDKFQGTPIKPVTVSFADNKMQGEAMITAQGIEGGAIYGISGPLRDHVLAHDSATFMLDLKPDTTVEALTRSLFAPRGTHSFANYLRRQTGLPPAAISLLREVNKDAATLSPRTLAELIKSVPLTTTATSPIDRAISSAGGIPFAELDENLMIKKLPSVFAAGEMLDWEAPTGGYLLQACFATAVQAANGMIAFVNKKP